MANFSMNWLFGREKKGSEFVQTLRNVGLTGKYGYPDTSPLSMTNLYYQNPVVNAAINARATAAAEAHMRVMQQTTDGGYAPKPSHPLRLLLARPADGVSEADFLKTLIASYDVTGLAYIELTFDKTGTTLAGMKPLNPATISKHRAVDGSNEWYVERIDGNERVIPVHRMLVRRNVGLDGRIHSLLAAAAGEAALDTAQTLTAREFYDKGMVVAGYLRYPEPLDEPERENIKELLEKYEQEGRKRHLVLDGGAEYVRLGTELDAQLNIALSDRVESRIAMVLGVPTQIIGASVGVKNATYSNYEQAQATFLDNTILPLLAEWRDWLEMVLLPYFEDDDHIRFEIVKLEWDKSEMSALAAKSASLEQRARENYKAGLMTLNEARMRCGLGPVENGDTFFTLPTSFTLTPVES